MTDELPAGWSIARLNNLLEPAGLFDGPFGSNLKTSDYTDAGVRVVRLENLANLRFVGEKCTYISKQKYESLRKHTLHEGDILVGSFVEEFVRVCLFPRLATPAIAKADCFCLRPRADLVDRHYLVLQLGMSRTRDALMEEIHGATRPRITTKQLRDLDVVLCPLPEQRRIAAKVEALLAEVNAARGRLARVPAILKRFRQAVLAAACSGRLTADWRAANSRAVRVGALLAARRGGRGEECLEPSFEYRPDRELPDNWSYVALGNVGEWASGGTPSKSRADYWTDGTVPWVSPKDMKSSLIGSSEDLITEKAAKETRLRVSPRGSVLFVVRGMILAHTFPVGLTTREVTFNQDIKSITPHVDLHAPYLLRALQSESMTILFAVKEATHGTLRVESATLRSWPIPLPPREEQIEIARRIDVLFKCIGDIEHRVALASSRAHRMPQAILAKAFRGELVPTEAELAREEGRDYEPAWVLLERIGNGRATRAVGAQKSKGPVRGRGRG